MKRRELVSAYAYLRVSSKGQIQGHGFERQAETITEFASEAGYEVVGTYRDAFTRTEADRPQFNENGR